MDGACRSGRGVVANMYVYTYVLVISPLGVMLLVYRPDTRGRVAPEGEGLQTATSRLRGDIVDL